MLIDPDFPDHWKTQMLAGVLGDDPAAPVYLIRLWGHCQNRKKTEFEKLPPMAIRAICKYPGDAETIDNALSECGFIDRDGDRIEVVGWAEHNSKMVAAWVNGSSGGRPKSKTQQKPNRNPEGTEKNTHKEPNGNPTETQPEKPETRPYPVKGVKGVKEVKRGEEGECKGETATADSGKPEVGRASPGPDLAGPEPEPEPTPEAKPPDEKPKRKKPQTAERPEWVEVETWDDYIAWRRSRKHSCSPTAWKPIERELREGMRRGYDPNEMLAEAMSAGWQGFKLGWYENRIGPSRRHSPNLGHGKSADVVEEAKRLRRQREVIQGETTDGSR